MKIKDIIRTLIESGEDFSDHSMQIDVNGEVGPRHGAVVGEAPCAFCEAWRTAQWVIGPDCPNFIDFEPGDLVLICGRAPGVVERVRMQVDVRMGRDGDSPRPIGTFAPEFVSHAPEEPEVFYRDRDNAIWKLTAPGTLSLCGNDYAPFEGKYCGVFTQSHVETCWGPLVKVDKP